MPTSKTISGLIEQQLPDFVKSDHPAFQNFIEAYYEWLEDPEGGNTTNIIIESERYRDIDYTLSPFIRLFKQEILPFFPEKTSLDISKVLKGARDFYNQKGTESSLKWLFRVLFDQEIEVYYPKKQILKASDGKWKLPLAFRLALSANNSSIDPNLLEKLKCVGQTSKATCVIESANKTIDRNFGGEIIEIYVSGLQRKFKTGEMLVIQGVEGYTTKNPFKEKIVSSISSIKIDSNIRTDPQQKKRGLLYNIGDPVIVTGGLDANISTKEASAYVESVFPGSVVAINTLFPGYGYRTYYNTSATIIASAGDEIGSNLTSNIIVSSINKSFTSGNSQISYLEYVDVDKMPIEYLATIPLNTTDYSILTVNNRNIILTINNAGTPWISGEYVYANGDSYLSANFKGKILSVNTGYTGANSNVIIYSVSNTLPLTTAGFLIGVNTLLTVNSTTKFNVASVQNTALVANINSQIIQTLVFETIETGGIDLISVISGGYGFRSVPSVASTSYYDTYLSQGYLPYAEDNTLYKSYREPINATGKIAHIYIQSGGHGYSNGDSIVVEGRGYGFVGNVKVDTDGTIVHVNIINRGEGYYGAKTAYVQNTNPITSNATIVPYGFGEGYVPAIVASSLGRISTIKLSNGGFGYIDTPKVSLKVVDMVIAAVPTIYQVNLEEGNFIYQGELTSPSFIATIKSYSTDTNLLRAYDYSGTLNYGDVLYTATYIIDEETTEEVITDLGYTVNINLLAKVPAPDLYPETVKSSGLPNPFFYGNGRAKALAEFFNGLIQYDGFFLNTDGFVSADKKLQDDAVYHNFSYVIQSESSLSDYKSIITDIIHPIGTSMLSKTIVYNTESSAVKLSNTYIAYVGSTYTTSNVQIQNSFSNVVTGNGTTFTSVLVGNLINVIDAAYPLRSKSAVVTGVANSTSLNVEGWFVYTGQGKLSTNSQNTVNIAKVNVIGRRIPQTGTVRIDTVRSKKVYATQNVLTGKAILYTNTVIEGTNSSIFTVQLSPNDLIWVPAANVIKKVVSISSNSSITINSAFNSTTIGATLYRLNANLISFTANDIIVIKDQEKLVVSINSERELLVNSQFDSVGSFLTFFKANTHPNTSNIIQTTGSAFTSTLTVNDIISVNNETRKVVQIYSATVVGVDYPFTYSSSASDVIKIDNQDYIINNYTNSISEFIAVGDTIRFNIAAYEEFNRIGVYSLSDPKVNIVSGNTSVLSRTGQINFNDSFGVKVGDIVRINNEIKRVISITNDLQIKVNSSFKYSATNVYCYKYGRQVDANVTSINGDIMSTNVSILQSNVSNLVYHVVPNYTTRNYAYSFISTAG